MNEINNPHLTPEEKILVLRNNTIQGNKKNYIPNIGDFLAENFNKIDGFDYRWSSLITSSPLLFEDVDYIRTKQFINNEITPEEIKAYKEGKLRELYATFENMLVCNLQYYTRIMNFCTMVFLHYIRLSEDSITSEYLDEIPFIMEMTPTQIWCCALSGLNSTEWELNYGWSFNGIKPIKLYKNVLTGEKSLLEINWNILYQNKIFNKFVEYSSLRTNTSGYRQTFLVDKTSNRKLSQVCSKFTKTSIAISDEQLYSLNEYINEYESLNQRLYTSLFECLKKIFNNDESQFAIYTYTDEFYIHTSKFSMRVRKDNGKISKDYLSNSYECFAAEEHLFNSVKTQIEWVKYKLPIQYEYDKQILINLLKEMLKNNFKQIICIRRMNAYGVLSKITFSGIFHMLYIQEELMFNNRSIKTSKICLSKENTAQYVIDRGYYLFGLEEDVYKISIEEKLTRQILVNHYSNYCIPVLQHMQEVITLHNMSKNDIIDVVCSGLLNPNKLNNENIMYTNVKGINDNKTGKKLLQNALDKQNKNIETNKKNYWKVTNGN